jgi:hypothetical protein
MAIARGASTKAVVVGSNAASLIINMASQTTGQFQLLFCASGNSSSIPTTPTGWTLLETSVFAYVFYRLNDGTEAATLTVTYTGGTAHIAQVMVAYSGVHATTPFEATPLHTTNQDAGNPQTIPSLTTTQPGDWIVGWAAPRQATATNVATAGSGLTIVQDAEVASATFQSTTVADSNGTVSIGAWTASGITYSTAPTSGAWGSLALMPAAVAYPFKLTTPTPRYSSGRSVYG